MRKGRFNILAYVLELVRSLVGRELNVCHPVPLDLAGRFVLDVGEAGQSAGSLGEEPGGDVLGQDDLGPQAEPEAADEEIHVGVLLGEHPRLGHLKLKERSMRT